MKIRNIAKCTFMHIVGDKTYKIEPNQEAIIPDNIAKLWLDTKKVVKVDDGKKDEEIAKLKEENKRLKSAQNAKNKKGK